MPAERTDHLAHALGGAQLGRVQPARFGLRCLRGLLERGFAFSCGAVVALPLVLGGSSEIETAAIVTRVGEKVIDLYLVGSGNRVITGVKHVTDPRLRLNDDMREGGSWDFRKSEQKILARINELATKIEAIEDALNPFGVKIIDLPLTPPRLLALIEAARRK